MIDNIKNVKVGFIEYTPPQKKDERKLPNNIDFDVFKSLEKVLTKKTGIKVIKYDKKQN